MNVNLLDIIMIRQSVNFYLFLCQITLSKDTPPPKKKKKKKKKTEREAEIFELI